MRVLPDGARILENHTQTIPAGFPIQTHAFRHDVLRSADILRNEFPQVRLLGRAAGHAFFMRDVLLNAWQVT
jgi:hypothetical protein